MLHFCGKEIKALFPEKTSITLLERVRARDQEAWGRLIYLYGPLIDHWCHRWGVAGADCEDIRQEVFQGVASNLGAFRRDRPGDTFRGWLRGITRNKLLDHLRRRDKQPHGQGGTDAQRRMLDVPEQDDLPDDSGQETSNLYHRALELVRSEFEERTWQMFWRAAVEGQAPADIAADMKVSPAAVRQAKSRVLRRLKEEVGDLIE